MSKLFFLIQFHVKIYAMSNLQCLLHLTLLITQYYSIALTVIILHHENCVLFGGGG